MKKSKLPRWPRLVVVVTDMNLDQGDLHRFGKQVILSSNHIFRKPRSLRLEQLVLDSVTPWKTLAHYLGYSPFGRVSNSESSIWEGESTSFRPYSIDCAEERDSSVDYARNCGRLLATATLFGWADLHAENILICRTPNGQLAPIPIDLEVAFWDCVSGMDTFLYPSTLISKKFSGFSGQLPDSAYQPQNPGAILDGFLECSMSLLPVLSEELAWLSDEMQGYPIRVLLRSTQFYRRILGRQDLGSYLTVQHPHGPLLEEEILQLEAGDVPYFFFTWGESHPKLKYFKTENQIQEVHELGSLAAVLDSASRPIQQLTEADRLNRLIQVTAVQLCQAYYKEGLGQPTLCDQFKLEWPQPTVCKLQTAQFSVQAQVRL